ncbi:MAG: 50S ribosomal protein L35 [Candidatus Pacebacteria bacterium]|nr:50S ribosomal protein L35 [Candidatus Paceibacterota bacterium]
MKIKTKKAVAKRFKISKTGKIIARTTGQDHFNSTDTGNQTRAKRNDKEITSGIKKAIRRQLCK